MRSFTAKLTQIAKFIGILGIFKDFFGDDARLAKIYRVLMGGLIAYILGRTAYMTYKVFKNGYVKEIQRRIDDDEENGEYNGSRPELAPESEPEDPEMEGEYGNY